MISPKTAVTIIVSAVISSLVTVFTMKALANWEIENAPKIEVLIATENIPVGTILTDHHLDRKTVFRDSVYSKVFRHDQKDRIVGRTLGLPLRKGEQVTWMHVGAYVF